MKNKVLARIFGNEVAKSVIDSITKFLVENQGTLLTVGSIGFSLASTATAMKNATDINYILADARVALDQCNTKEERSKVYGLTLKALLPKLAPIVIFELASITCSILNKRRTDKIETRLVETAGALAIAQKTITECQKFQREAEMALGEEKVHEIQKDIDENTVYQVASASPVNTRQSDNDKLIYEPITGQLIWSTPDRVNLAWEKYKSEVMNSEKQFVPVSDIFFDRIGADSRTMSAEVFGYYNEDASRMSDTVYLDSTKVVVNGEETAVLKINYYPSIRLVTDEVFD